MQDKIREVIAAMENNRKICIRTRPEDKEKVVGDLLFTFAKIDPGKRSGNNLDKDEWRRLIQAAATLSSSECLFVDVQANTPKDKEYDLVVEI